LSFEAHTAKQLSIADPSPTVVAAHALERRQEWAKSTWRQFKAALTFRFLAMGTPEALEAVELLRDGNQSPCAKKTRRTSGRRAKNVSPDALQAVVRRVQSSESKYGPVLSTWLLLGAEIGLRPHEWGQSSLVRLPPEDVGDEDSPPGSPLPYLRIRNAKGTNGRSHGDHRHLNLSALRPDLVELVGRFAKMMSDVAERGDYARYYGACVKLLYRVNRELHRHDQKRWVQLYSPRHRFSAEAKQQLDAEGVAALMGHGTTKTAAKHYGRRVTATGTLGPRPIAAEVARVRKIRGYNQSRKSTGATPALPAPATKQGSGGS
jgi:hypothetical protein